MGGRGGGGFVLVDVEPEKRRNMADDEALSHGGGGSAPE